MSRTFVKDARSRSEGYILPDNYIGIGRAEELTIIANDSEKTEGNMRHTADLVGGFERALMLGLASSSDKLDVCLVQFLDLRDEAGDTVYGTIAISELALGMHDSDKYRRLGNGRLPIENICRVGRVITVELSSDDSRRLFSRGHNLMITFQCSRANVLRVVRRHVSNLDVGELLLGRVSSRSTGWGYRVDLGSGFTVILPEDVGQKHSLRCNGIAEGSLMLLTKGVSILGDTTYEAYTEPWREWCPITHRSRVEGVISRADDSGCVYAYVPNIGFIYVAGMSVGNEGENIGFTKKYSEEYGGNTHGYIAVELGSGDVVIDVGDKVLLEVIQGFGDSVCGYIVKKLKNIGSAAVC